MRRDWLGMAIDRRVRSPRWNKTLGRTEELRHVFVYN